jgi:hypothetical protein
VRRIVGNLHFIVIFKPYISGVPRGVQVALLEIGDIYFSRQLASFYDGTFNDNCIVCMGRNSLPGIAARDIW